MGIFDKITNKVNNYIDNKKKELEIYNTMINNSLVFTLDKELVNDNNNLVTGNMYEYNEMCPYIGLDFANVIDGIIPIYETVLSISHIKEIKDNQEFILVITSIRIIVLNKEKYTNYNFDDIKILNLIDKKFMSHIINFNNIIIEIDVDDKELTNIYNLITNINYRNNIILDKTKYLCGIIPIYQKINKIGSGISIDINNNIVFHDKKINNYLFKYNDILNYELMEDDTPVLRKKVINQSQGMGSIKKECYKMSLRLTLNDNKVFEITILEPTTFNNAYSHMDKTYLEYYNFGKEIIDKLDSLNNN